MALVPCSQCGRHHLTTATLCPHCGLTRSASLFSTTPGLALLGLVLTACGSGNSDTAVQALYGVPDTGQFLDQDNDGYSVADGDCDDNDPDRHPGATETAGDDVDSNCDDEDDPATDD